LLGSVTSIFSIYFPKNRRTRKQLRSYKVIWKVISMNTFSDTNRNFAQEDLLSKYPLTPRVGWTNNNIPFLASNGNYVLRFLSDVRIITICNLRDPNLRRFAGPQSHLRVHVESRRRNHECQLRIVRYRHCLRRLVAFGFFIVRCDNNYRKRGARNRGCGFPPRHVCPSSPEQIREMCTQLARACLQNLQETPPAYGNSAVSGEIAVRGRNISGTSGKWSMSQTHGK